MDSLELQRYLVPESVVELMKPFDLKLDKLIEMITIINNAFNEGLHADADEYYYSPIRMLPTHLSDVPTGSEDGVSLSIDLGGTNLRIFKVQMKNGKLVSESFNYEVPVKYTVSSSSDLLFDFIAECLQESLAKLNMDTTWLPLVGFTFSFPCNQKSLCSATLIRWTKGYKIDNVEGKDVVELLKESCKKKGLKIGNFPIVNDTTGTLMCGAFDDKDTVIAIINGTGTNACYIEKLELVTKWQGSRLAAQIIINTEWGAFGERNELEGISTKYDRAIDSNSLHPGQQRYEKMMSGMYVGEIVRMAISDLVDQNLLFGGVMPMEIKEFGSLPSAILSSSYSFEELYNNFKNRFNITLNEQEAKIIAYVCDAVIARASRLTAVGLSALLKRVNRPRSVVAADGSMFRKHPKFLQYTTEVIKLLVPENPFKIILADDGSGKGAALAAYVASTDSRSGLALDVIN